MVKTGCCQSGHKTLKLAVFQKCIDGYFLHVGTHSGKLKVN